MNEIAARDMAPEQTFTAAATGPVLADVTCPDGTVTVTVDPAATVATVRVFTQDGPDSPAADAARGARIQQNAERLVVVVPKVKQNGANFGGVTFQSFGGGGVTYVNGVQYSGNVTMVNGQGGAQGFTRGVEVHVTLPAGSGVQYSGENGSLHTYGTVAAIRAGSSNGSIKAETVGRIEAEAGNGSIKVGTVTEWIDADASNGSVKVDNHIGNVARVRAGNGSVNFTVGARATGRIDIKAGNGTVRLYGVRGRDDLDVRATAGNGSVKKF
ncbi:hypothetical protein [Streptomyces candidus]|uniref:Adhesin domain-containing protein n=1 Tax=Streptomyces candidus TaxID=67283 RepID=A0A7X0HLJ6_9ACTN|nr:hypothetical protein [Streptomyces candidus]MBB6439937.1 hypothetical protein [Streptomyces candidus]GHH56173.1 hypothetical protein GCM10018773_61680 [Streptomyces candidus]